MVSLEFVQKTAFNRFIGPDQSLKKCLLPLLQDGLKEIILGLEIPVESPFRETDRVRDILDGGALKPLVKEEGCAFLYYSLLHGLPVVPQVSPRSDEQEMDEVFSAMLTKRLINLTVRVKKKMTEKNDTSEKHLDRNNVALYIW
jgi:hypothetical protein